jgi:galactokinase
VAHRSAFLERYGDRDPGSVRLFFAPGRVNLMGAHLDYNGGPVMPMAIERGTFVALRPRADKLLTLASTSEDTERHFDLAALRRDFPAATGAWWDYPLGVLRALGPEHASHGADILFGGDLPVGAGLSSSASVTLATAVALDRLFDLGHDVQSAVDAALDAERGYVGVKCGIMDPYAVGHARPGQVLVLDCATRRCQHAALDATQYAVAVVDTGVRRELASGEFNKRVEQCGQAWQSLAPLAPGAENLSSVPLEILAAHEVALENTVAKRARHVIEETARTLAARDALIAGDVPAFGRAMFDAHTSLRDLFEVSIPELDAIVDHARTLPFVLGARLTGAGFGGCVAAVIAPGHETAVARPPKAHVQERFGHEPGVAFYRSSPGLGEVELTVPGTFLNTLAS